MMKRNIFVWLDKPQSLHTGCTFELIRITDTDKCIVKMHTAAHETGRVLVAAKDGAFCMEVRVMIKQAEIPKCQHFGFVSKTPSNSCSSCSISAAFHHTILVHSALSRKRRYVTGTLFYKSAIIKLIPL